MWAGGNVLTLELELERDEKGESGASKHVNNSDNFSMPNCSTPLDRNSKWRPIYANADAQFSPYY